MRKDMVKMGKEELRDIIDKKDSSIDYAMQKAKDYMEKWCEELDKTHKLQHENGYLKALFDKESDTEVIKYNGKIYSINSMILSIGKDEPETLNIDAVEIKKEW